MENLRSTVRAVCFFSAAYMIIEGIIGATKLSSSVRTVMKLILAIIVIMPFVRNGREFEMPELCISDIPETTFSDELYKDEVIRQTTANIEQVLAEQLTAAGINFGKIDVEVNIPGDGSIIISRVTLDTDDYKSAEAIVRNCLGSNTEVRNADS